MDKDLIKALYEAFEDEKQSFIDAGVKPIATIDRYRGQPLNPEQFEYYELPALFFQRPVSWEREGNVYNGLILFTFHLVTDPTWEASNIATNKDAGLKYYTLVDKVREVLDNFKTAFTGTMFRTQDSEIDTGVVMYDTLGYQCEYYGTTKIKPVYDESSYEPEGLRILGRHLKR